MRKNWKNRDGKKMPQIAVVRDALNKELSRHALIFPNKKYPNIDLFCIGFGFKRPMFWGSIDLTYNKECPIPGIDKKMVDAAVVCDLLALSEIIPTQAELSELETAVEERWQKYASQLLDNINLDETVTLQLEKWIQEHTRRSAENWLHLTPAYQLWYRFRHWQFFRKFNRLNAFFVWAERKISFSQHLIDEISSRVGREYIFRITQASKQVFWDREKQYRAFIQDSIQKFVDDQTRRLVQLLTLGHEPTKFLETFDEVQVKHLAELIYGYLRKDVEKKLFKVWLECNGWLAGEARRINAHFSVPELRRLTEACIKKSIWELLRPYVKKTVVDVFVDAFKLEAKRCFPDWIGLAARREIKRPIDQIVRLLPDALEQDVYSDQFMFGATPIQDAIYLCSLRMLDPNVRGQRKILLIISDGEFDSAIPLDAADMLRKSGVIIISCCIYNRNLLDKNLLNVKRSWPKGAKTLFEMASPIEPGDWLLQALEEKGIKVDFNDRWFRQINQAGILEEVFENILQIGTYTS
jgi:hypothetical protein